LARNLTPTERDQMFGPVIVDRIEGRDTIVYQDPPGVPPQESVQFGPHTVRVHQLAAPSLRAVAAEMVRDGVVDAVETIGGFRPTMTRTAGGGNTDSVSAHAYGAAVDVNAASNPQGSEPTPEMAELAAYFEPHGWFWGARFTTPDPHHFAFQGNDPLLRVETGGDGLLCPVNADVFRRDHRIRLFPGRIQRWVMAVRAGPQAEFDALQDHLITVFRRWHELIPGKYGEPLLLPDVSREQLAIPRLIATRAPQLTCVVEWPYAGTATEMGVPTFVLRRRDRIDPVCPVEPVDDYPIAALDPGPAVNAIEFPQLPPPSRIDEDPLDAGLPPVDVEKARKAVRGAVSTATIVGVGLLAWGLYGFFRDLSKER